jgi:hypothetical protein
MKKLILAGLLSVAGLMASSGTADAFLLHRLRCCHRYSCKINVRPYNAFTPVCFGSMTCIGTAPGCCGGGHGGFNPMMPSVFAHGGFDDGCCVPGHGPGFDHGPAGEPGEPGKQMPPANDGKKFIPPVPNPVPTTAWYYPQTMPYYYSPVHQAAYRANYQAGYQAYQGYPGYQPTYNPYYNYGYYPTVPAYSVPSYWYGGM